MARSPPGSRLFLTASSFFLSSLLSSSSHILAAASPIPDPSPDPSIAMPPLSIENVTFIPPPDMDVDAEVVPNGGSFHGSRSQRRHFVHNSKRDSDDAAPKSAADIILEIMPTSGSCTGADSQCATNVQAAPYFIDAFQQYGIYDYASMAAMLALVALETGQLKSRRGAESGQGTSNMQHLQFNEEFGTSIPALAADIAAANGDPDKVLDLVTQDAYNFATAPWYLSTQCTTDVRSQLATGSEDGFTAYIVDCVHTTMTQNRKDYWTTAKKAFGLS